MKVILWRRAEKDLKRFPKIDQLAISKKIRKIISEQEKVPTEKLKGFKNIGRIRVGCYRMIYIKSKEKIEIFLIAHRREVYNLLKKLL